MNLVQLTLAAPALFAEELAEYLLGHPDFGGAFTLFAAEGRGSPGSVLSSQEQVRGRALRTVFAVVLEHDVAQQLLAQLKVRYPKRDVAYWLTPVLEFGRLA